MIMLKEIFKDLKKNDWTGMGVYCAASLVFGGGVGVLLLALKENADRCHYYGGKWSVPDLVRGCAAVAVGMAVRWLLDNGLNLF